MGGDDDRKRQQGPGAELFEQARQRAEAFLREVSNLGGSTQQQAGERVDQLWSVGRWSADQLMEAVRREVAAQLGGLGLATKKDLDELEQRLTARIDEAAAAAAVMTATPAPAAKTTAKKAPAAKKSTAAKKTATAAKKTSAAKRTPTPAKKAPAKKATGSRKAADS